MALAQELEHRAVVEHLALPGGPHHRTGGDPQRDHHRRHARAALREGIGLRLARRRLDVVVEAAVLVVGDNQRGALPDWALPDRVVDVLDQRLPELQVARRVVVVRLGKERIEHEDLCPGIGRFEPGQRGKVGPCLAQVAGEALHRPLVIVAQELRPQGAHERHQRQQVVAVHAPRQAALGELVEDRVVVVVAP